MTESEPGIWGVLIKYGWMFFVFVFGLQHKTNRDLHGRMSNIKDDMTSFELKVATNNVTKQDHKDMLEEIRLGFSELKSELKGKADK